MDHRIKSVISLMKDDLRRDLPLGKMAQAVNLSISRLQHLFKLETGMTPAQYRRLLRIEKARDLLETSLLSVKEIRTSVGIYERSHFEREFKKIYGSTPAEYRAAAFSQTKEQQKLNR